MDKTKVTPSKISMGMWMVLIGIAAFFDVLEFIFAFGVVIGTIIDAFAFATFWLIFKMNGEKYSGKTMMAGAIVGFIPFINMLPECTATIAKLYLNAKKRNALAKAEEKKATASAPKNKRVVGAQNTQEKAPEVPEENLQDEFQEDPEAPPNRNSEVVEGEPRDPSEDSGEEPSQNPNDNNQQQAEFGEIPEGDTSEPEDAPDKINQNTGQGRNTQENDKHFRRQAPQRDTNTQIRGLSANQPTPQNTANNHQTMHGETGGGRTEAVKTQNNPKPAQQTTPTKSTAEPEADATITQPIISDKNEVVAEEPDIQIPEVLATTAGKLDSPGPDPKINLEEQPIIPPFVAGTIISTGEVGTEEAKEELGMDNVDIEATEQFNRSRRNFPQILSTYKIETGIAGMVGGTIGILNKISYDCSTLVIQTKTGVSVINIPPNSTDLFNDSFGIGTKIDLFDHVRSALKGLVIHSSNLQKTGGDLKLTAEEIKKLQGMSNAGLLKITMITGKDQTTSSRALYELTTRARMHGLPAINPNVRDVGGLTSGDTGYSVYANPDSLYVLDSNNNVLK